MKELDDNEEDDECDEFDNNNYGMKPLKMNRRMNPRKKD